MNQLLQTTIQRVIPHRYPFLLVDRVTELVPGERIVGTKNFTASEDGVRSYFSGAPQAPAGLLMEMVTQLVAEGRMRVTVANASGLLRDARL
jgi:3-hydroxymyristoyl/3-hydroxydecanoyl-(acyl carrier protein) dehydratase